MKTTAEKIELFYQKESRVNAMGGEKQIAKQHGLGKLTARERVNLLFDPDTFQETDKFVTHQCTYFNMDKVEIPADGVITGYGKVNGRLVYVFAQDFTSVGGTMGLAQAEKICKIMDIAASVGAPVVGLNDSGGARIQEGINSLSGYGKMFLRNIRYSGVIPQITAIMGPTAGGAVYSPAMMDFIFMVKGTGQMFITGPEVIKAAIGEIISPEELGGAITHNKISGNAHFVCDNDVDCIDQIKKLLSYLPSNNQEAPPVTECHDPANRVEDKLNTIIPDAANRVYNMKQLIKMLVDNGEYFEVQPLYSPNLLTLFARLNGHVVGIIANQPIHLSGCLDVNASDKGARFIRFCDAFNIPLLTFTDTPGFLPGKNQEFTGIIRHGAKMLFAYGEATVPKITVIIRKAYGGAYMAMCGKDLAADQVIAWPTAQIAVMGAQGAANIIFRKEIAASADPEALRQEKIEEYETLFNNPYIAASRGLVDIVCEPKQTRPTLIRVLDSLLKKKETLPWKKHCNIPL
ncbi:MAG: methylmalonyl-CoA carboxyltransferase [Syntrophomonadaceae bacterium]|nr:methylmalonyl-CoA carboxyltransferase [Syntrophomonadaceae bacterium]